MSHSSLPNDKKLFNNPPSSPGVAVCTKGNRYFGNTTSTGDTRTCYTLHDSEVSAKHTAPLLFPWKVYFFRQISISF